ncbi:antirestriction protein [Escherichia coli]
MCEDYCGGIWNLYTLNNGGAFMAPEPDDDDDETWVLFNAMNGNRAEMSPEAAGIVTNGAIVIHTQRLKSDPGGNLLS